MCKSRGREEELSDVVQMRLVLAGFLGEVAGLRFGPCRSSQSHSPDLYVNTMFS